MGVADEYGGKHIRLRPPKLLKRHYLRMLPLAAYVMDKAADGFGRFMPEKNITGSLQVVGPFFTGRVIQNDTEVRGGGAGSI